MIFDEFQWISTLFAVFLGFFPKTNEIPSEPFACLGPLSFSANQAPVNKSLPFLNAFLLQEVHKCFSVLQKCEKTAKMVFHPLKDLSDEEKLLLEEVPHDAGKIFQVI